MHVWTQEVESNGFTILEDVLPLEEVAHLSAELCNSTLTRSRAGIRNLLSHAAVHDLALHPRLLGLARAVIGDSVRPLAATLFEKPAARSWLVAWHQDATLPLRER